MSLNAKRRRKLLHPRLLVQDAESRVPAHPTVLDWMRPDSWLSTISELMGDVVTHKTIAALIADPPEYIVSDNLTWLNRLISDDFDIKSLMTERLRARFRAIRTCHATRTDNVETFYREGIRALDKTRATIALRALLKEKQNVHLTRTVFNGRWLRLGLMVVQTVSFLPRTR